MWNTKDKETRYLQVQNGLRRHAEWIKQKPTVILGDFNNGGSFDNSSWKDLLGLTESLELVSAYHQHTAEQFGEETSPTYYFKGEETLAFHVDYIFLPKTWAPHITKAKVGDFHYWHNLSNHMPVWVDLDL